MVKNNFEFLEPHFGELYSHREKERHDSVVEAFKFFSLDLRY